MGERIQIALQVGMVGVVLAAATFGIVSSATTTPPTIAAPASTPGGPDASLIASTLRTATPTPIPPGGTPRPSPTFATLPPSPSPTASPRPPVLSRYSFNGRAYTGVVAEPGTVFVAPFDARVEVVYYQILEGEFRSGTDVAGEPHYPYVFLFAPDRVMKLRPGADKSNTEVLVRTTQVLAGTPLFRVTGPDPSSWHYRYDASVRAQVIVSLTNGDETADLDAAPFVKTQ